MHIRFHKIVFSLVAASLLAGCGKGKSSDNLVVPAPTSTVMGVAAAGLISKAKVSIYKGTNQTTALKTMTTGANGVYSFDIPSDTGAVIIKVEPATGATMLDERDGSSHPFTKPIRTALPVLVTGTNYAHATPFTEAMVKSIEADPTPAKIIAAKTIIMTITGADPVMTPPVHIAGASAADLAKTAIMVDKLARLNTAAENDSTCGTAANAAFTLGDRLGCMSAKIGVAMVLNGATVTPNTVTINPILANMNNATFAVPLKAKVVTMSTAASAPAPVDAPVLSAEAQASVAAAVTQLASASLVPVTAPTATAMAGVATAKSFFQDFRATGNLYSNAGKTGFLDKQGARINADLSAAVMPNMLAMGDVSTAISAGQELYREVQDGTWQTNLNNMLQVMDRDAATNVPTSVRVRKTVWLGIGRPQLICKTSRFKGSVAADVIPANAGKPAGSTKKVGESISWDANYIQTTNTAVPVVNWEPTTGIVVRCDGPEKVTYNPDGSQSVDYFQITLTPAANWTAENGNFSYKADKWHVINNADGSGSETSLLATVPYMSGTIASVPPGTTLTGSITVKGDFPSLAAGAYKESVDISLASTETATSVRVDFKGLISSSNQSGGLLSSLGIGQGSYATMDVTSVQGVKTIGNPSALHLIIEASSPGTKLTGTLDGSAFKTDASGINPQPTSVAFTGTISDTSTGGVGNFLTGKVEHAITDYNLYNSQQPSSNTNYQKITDTFTGTVTFTGQTPLQLVLSNSATGVNSSSSTISFTYASGKKITGTETVTNGVSSSIALTDTSGVSVTIPSSGGASDIKVGNAIVGNINNGVITYADFTVESVN